jgi:DNA polymerase-3 subunit gamma/tau
MSTETDNATAIEEGFARKYRPRRFEDVVGQGSVVTFLANLIRRGKRRRDLLLHGSVGSGKTSLARIYGQALNCDAPQPSGSPCRGCASCADPKRHFLEYDVPGRGGDQESIRRFLATVHSEAPAGNVRVLFFDEAHRLDAVASDILLKRVEERDDNAVYIFATTEVERIRPALASRLIALEVLPLGVDDAVALLTRTADSENIRIEPDALMMLAGLRQGYPRDLLTGLELAVDEDGGVITLDRVKEIFDIEVDSLVAYLGAVAGADVEQQLQSIRLWRVSAADKMRWIQALLTSLYYNEILGVRLIVDAAIESIGDAERHKLVAAFQRRFGVDRTNLRSAWRRLLQFWQRASEVPADDATMNLQVALFNELVIELAEVSLNVPARREPLDQIPSLGDDRASRRSTELSPSNSADADSGRFTTAEDVRTIFNSASFLIQEYGKFFDLSIKFLPRNRGTPNVDDGATVTADYCSGLVELIRREIGEGTRVPMMRILEGEDASVRGFVLASLVPDQADGAFSRREALVEWARHCAVQYAGSYDVSVAISPSSKRAALRWHWEQARNLCAGIDAATADTDPRSGRSKPLHELVGLSRHQLRLAQPLRISRIILSDEINGQAVAHASDYGMRPLSAFDERSWDVLASGWEMQEHFERKRMIARRKLEIRRTTLEFGQGTPLQMEAEAQLRLLWGDDPMRRARSRIGWWSR